MLRRYRDQIIIEVTGHDHLADFRTHSVHEEYDSESNCMQKYSDDEDSHFFLGKMISPSITPGSDTQPGYTTFTLEDNQIKDVVMTFL